MRNRRPRSLVVLVMPLLLAAYYLGAAAATYHYVAKNETLWLISQKYGVTPAQIQAANNLKTTTIYSGQRLLIPESSAGDTWVYTIKSGDTLYLIAQRYGTTVNTLRTLNGLSSDYLQVGQRLRIPGSDNSQPKADTWVYTVKSGDTLYLIAQRYGTTVNMLRSLNNIWTDYLTVGQRLLIPNAAAPAPYSVAELDLLARLVTAEAEGEPYVGMVAVAAVVFAAEWADPRYPNSIHGVIYQVVDTYYYQFSPVMDGRINMPASPLAVKAVQEALAGSDPSKGALGFYNPAKTTNKWVKSRPVTTVIGDHVFFVH